MKMKRLLAGFVLLSLILIISCQKSEEETYKFGAVLSLTGAQSFYGTFAKAGIEIAIDDINELGGINGRNVKVIYEDSESNKNKAAISAQKLINVDQVNALFTITPPMAETIAPIAEENKIPSIFISGTNSFAENKKYVFKDYPSAEFICEQLYDKAINEGHSNIALFGLNYESIMLCKKGIEKVGRLSAFETYNTGDSDFRTQLTKIKASESTAIILLSLANECKTAYKQIGELQLNAQLYLPIHTFTCGNKENSVFGKEQLVNAYAGDVAINEDSTDPLFMEFKRKLEENGQAIHPVGSAMMYDVVIGMAKAYENCEDSQCVTENIRKLNYKGITGNIAYNGDQIVERDIRLYKFTDGKWVKVE